MFGVYSINIKIINLNNKNNWSKEGIVGNLACEGKFQYEYVKKSW